jgi:predicted RNA-binding protein with PIN domain
MPLLIDGYNVLFALGLVPKHVGPKVLEGARAYLLNLVADALGERARDAAVVFDAAGAPKHAPGDYFYRGIDVRFARRKQEADDLIEDLIRQCAVPKQLVVVSSDQRLRQAAGRRGATSVKADELLEWLDAQRAAARPSPPPAAAPERAGELSADQLKRWLDEFEHLDRDPTLGAPPDYLRDFEK